MKYLVVGIAGWLVVHAGLVLAGLVLGGGIGFALHNEGGCPDATPVIGEAWSVEPTPLLVYVGDDTLRTATKVAIVFWNGKMGAEQFQLTAGVEDIRIRWSDTLSVAAGWYPENKLIEVSTNYRPGIDCLHCALIHELGHILGFSHGEDGAYGLAAIND